MTDALEFIKACEFLQKLGFGIKIYAGTNVIDGKYKATNAELIAFAKSKGFEVEG